MREFVQKLALLFFCVAILYCRPFYADWVFTPEDEWHYLDENGNFVKNSIVRKDGLEFYLDDTGHVYKEGMLNVNNVTYYFNYFGAKASNCWVKVDPYNIVERTEPIPEYYYYYFDENGKAVKGTTGKPRFFSLDGKTYLFNEYGQLLVGWIREDGTVIDPEEYEHPYEEAYYYSNSEGELISGWIKAENTYNDEKYLEDTKYLWFYFEPKTYKKRGYGKVEEKDIGTGHYIFSDKGYLYTDFISYSLNNASPEAYYGEDKGGKKYKAQWAWTLPPDDGTYSEDEMSEKHWMYFEKSGKPVKNEVRKINSKYYAFSENGIMQTGIVAYLNGTVLFVADMELTSYEDIVKKGKFTYRKNGEIYYFYDPWYHHRYHSRLPHYFSGDDWYNFDASYTPYKVYYYAMIDKEVNDRLDFSYTGRRVWDLDPSSPTFCDMLSDDIGYLYNRNIQYFYFGDDGALVEKPKKVHMSDGEYVYGSDRSGHYHGKRNGKYYYDGFLLAADAEIGYGIYCIEESMPETKQKLLYDYLFRPSSYKEASTFYVDPSDYDAIIDTDLPYRPSKYDWFYRGARDVDNESLYKVLDPNGKIVKSKKKAYKDKQGRYWFIDGADDSLRGLFSTEIKRMSSKVTLNTILDKRTCPRVFVNGTTEQMINFFKTITDHPTDPSDYIYLAELIFTEDFKDAYNFDLSGTITDVIVSQYGDDENKLQVTLAYNGVYFKSMRNDKYTFIPFGIYDENGDTATFFAGYNDFEIRPDENDLFVNCNWDCDDSYDLFDSDGDGIQDYY